MKKDRISQTALKVALGLITLSIKDDWAERLPHGIVEIKNLDWGRTDVTT